MSEVAPVTPRACIVEGCDIPGVVSVTYEIPERGLSGTALLCPGHADGLSRPIPGISLGKWPEDPREYPW